MLNKMYVDKKELLVFEIDQDKLHIVKDLPNYQFYKRSSFFSINKYKYLSHKFSRYSDI